MNKTVINELIYPMIGENNLPNLILFSLEK